MIQLLCLFATEYISIHGQISYMEGDYQRCKGWSIWGENVGGTLTSLNIEVLGCTLGMFFSPSLI